MKRFAEHLALGNSMPRTRHCYYRDFRLVQEYFNADPATGAGQIYSRSDDFFVLRIFFVAMVYVNTYIRPV